MYEETREAIAEIMTWPGRGRLSGLLPSEDGGTKGHVVTASCGWRREGLHLWGNSALEACPKLSLIPWNTASLDVQAEELRECHCLIKRCLAQRGLCFG